MLNEIHITLLTFLSVKVSKANLNIFISKGHFFYTILLTLQIQFLSYSNQCEEIIAIRNLSKHQNQLGDNLRGITIGGIAIMVARIQNITIILSINGGVYTPHTSFKNHNSIILH